MASHFHALTIKDIRNETSDCISVELEVPDHLKQLYQFKQGQNLTFRKDFGGEELRRSYSICSSPHEGRLRVAIKQAQLGRFSTFANKSFRVGDQVEVMTPTGSFFTPLKETQKKNYLAFAAGSGITPVISILKAILHIEPQSEFTLIYANRNRASVIFREELENLKDKYLTRLRLIHIFSREKTEVPLFHGRIDEEKCRVLAEKLIQLNNIDEIFICGPQEMIETVSGFLKIAGVPNGKIHFELFTTPGVAALPDSTMIREIPLESQQEALVSVSLDGVTSSFTLNYAGDSILNAALKQGIDLPFACKGGVCSSCRAKLTAGNVIMDANYALEESELNEGFILTCQSHPRSANVSVNFDLR